MAIQHGILAERPTTSHSNLFQAEQVSEVVRRFYVSGEISHQSPERKDFVTLTEMDWNFFAPSHGKGPIDDIGGTVKRTVWRQILRGTALINTAERFSSEAKIACPKINILLCLRDI
ncbi:(S)-beta-bisabolene synthase [Plakobranchus ocellatus]|uniref:(S)-beta-bisabolene synthase n=1 Tax=Plakobranchus ocellatus TaxID=259542 RepID=A0AAV4B6Z2_9GAST|nr:(S)-beta-bisabolene synthase [Plakobranchus ocellatus]